MGTFSGGRVRGSSVPTGIAARNRGERPGANTAGQTFESYPRTVELPTRGRMACLPFRLALVAFATALLLVLPTSAHADVSRAQATQKALAALDARSGTDALVVLRLPEVLPTGTAITQAGPDGRALGSRRAPGALGRADVVSIRAPRVAGVTAPSWFFYADEGPNQAFEHPGRVVLVDRATGKVTVSRTLRWVPLVDGARPAFFRSAEAYAADRYRVFERAWRQRAQAATRARAAQASAAAQAAQQRLADALAGERACALRVSDTLGDFYDFGQVDKTRASLGRLLRTLSERNGAFRTALYRTADGATPAQAVQALVERGCQDVLLYVAGGATRAGEPVIGVRPTDDGRVQWHTVGADVLERVVRANPGVSFKLVLDVPFGGKLADALQDERNVSVLLTAGGADEPSFSYLPQIAGPNGIVRNPSNPFGLLEFTNSVVRGLDRVLSDPREMDRAIAAAATGQTTSALDWLLARALEIGPTPFSNLVVAPGTQRVPPTTAAPAPVAAPAPPAAPLNHTPVAAATAFTTAEDTPADLTLTATDPDGDPLTFTVTSPPAHGTLTGSGPFLRYAPASDFHGADALTYAVSDGRGGTATGTVAITVTPVDDATAVVPGAAPATFTENGAAVTLAPSLTLVDPDSTEAAGAEVAITAGRRSGDALAFTPQGGISGSFDAQSGVLALAGTASLEAYRDALRSVTFASTSDDPGTSRTFGLTVAGGTPASVTLAIDAVNDAPVLRVPSTTTAATEDTDLAFPAGGALELSVADPDAGGGAVQVTVTTSAGTVTAPGAGAIAAGDGTGTLTLTGPLAQVDAALDGLVYSPAPDANGPASLTLTADDQGNTGSGGAQTDTATVNLAIAPVNDAPTLTPRTGTIAYTEGVPAVQVTDGTIADPDDTDLAQVVVTIASGREDEDELSFGGAPGIVSTYDATTGALTLLPAGASATVAQFEAALHAVSFGASTSENPGASRTLTIALDDGEDVGTATRTVAVTAVNDAPVATLPASRTATEDVAFTFAAGTVRVADVDAGTAAIDAALSVDAGTLTLAGTTGLTVVAGANGTSAMTVRGALADVNAALSDLAYTPVADATVPVTLTLTADDRGATGTGGAQTDTATLTWTPSAVNDAPVATAPAAATVVEDEPLTFSVGTTNPLRVADVDAGAGNVTVDLAATHGTVTLGATTGLTVSGDGTAAVTATGTLAALNTALEGTTFVSDDDYDGPAELTLDVDDNGNTGSGGAQTGGAVTAIDVDGVNDAPTITAPATATVNQDAARTFSTANGNRIAIADSDAGTGAIAVELGVAQGTLTLARTTGLTFTTGSGAPSAALAFTGTVANVAAALDGLVYTPAPGYFGPDALAIDVDDQGNTGAGGAQTATASVALTVLEANSPPVNVVPGAQTLTEDTTLTLSGATKLAVSDPNVPAATGTLEVDLDVDHGALTLDGIAGLTFSAGDGTSDAAMTLRGAPDAINAALDGLTYTPAANHAGADTLTLTTSDLGASGPGGTLTDADAVALTVTAVNDAPVLTAPASITAAEDTTQAVAGLSLADVDAGGADLRLRLALADGTITLGTTTGLSFTTGDGTADPTIVAEGTVGELSAALATLTIRGTQDFNGTDTLDVDVSDLGNAGAGGTQTDAEEVPVTITAVNDAPVNTVPGAQTVAEDATLTLGGAGRVAVADVDAGTDDVRVSLGATNGTLTLATTTGLTFTTGDGTADAALVFSGTLARIDAALDGLQYAPAANFAGAASITVTTNDLGHTGSGGAQSDTDAVAITVTAVNDTPVLTQPDAGALAYAEDDPTENHADVVAPNLTVADVDSANLAGATVTIGALAAGDELVFVDQNGITGSYAVGSGVLTLTGSSSVANYQAALRSVRYRTTSENPSTAQRTITFRANDGAELSNQVTRAIDVTATNDAPVAGDLTFNAAKRAVGNTTLVVDDASDAAPSVGTPRKLVSGDILASATDADSGTAGLTITPQTGAATANGGRVTLEADGDFVYDPPQGCGVTSDAFDYTLNDNDALGNRTDTGTVTIAVADCVWYVNSTTPTQPAAADGGTSRLPYKTLAAIMGAGGAGDEDAAGDRILVYGPTTYTGPLPLENGQQLYGQSHGLTVPDGGSGSVTLVPAAGSNPTISGVVLATDNVVQGLTFGASSGYSLSGTSVGNATINTVTAGGAFNAVGGAVDINGTGNNLDISLSTMTAAGGSNAYGVRLVNATGRFSAGSGTLSGASSGGVLISGGTADVTLAANLTHNGGGRVVSVADTTGGTKDFDGTITRTTTGAGIALTDNTGATIRFDGALNLTTQTGAGFTATGGGTIAAPAAANTITTTTGTPLTVTGTAIRSDGLQFRSISANGAPNGIVLSGTGSAGGLTVTGNGNDCTVATPTCTGGTIQNTTGAAIDLANVGHSVALTRMRITGAGDDGLRAATVAGLQLASSLVTGNGDAAGERGLDLANVTGSLAVTNGTVSGSYADNVQLENGTGTVDFDLTGSTVAGARNGDGVRVVGGGAANVKADVTGNVLSANYGDAFRLATTPTATTPTMNLNFTTNQVSADATQVAAGALVVLSAGSSAATRIAMSGNTLDTAKGSALILNPVGSAQFDATVSGDTVRNAGGIGIWAKPAQQAKSRVRIVNTTVLDSRGQGMVLRHGEGVGGTADYVLQGSTIRSTVGLEGLNVEAGTTSSGTESVAVCADIGGAGPLANDLADGGGPAGGGTSYDDVTLARYAGSQLVLPGYTGGSDPTPFLRGRNLGTLDAYSWGPQDPTTGPACQTPNLPPAP